MGEDFAEPGLQPGSAFLGGKHPPRRQGTFGGGNSAAGFIRTHARHMAEHFASGRVGHGNALATVGCQPFSVDIANFTQQITIGKVHVDWLVRRREKGGAVPHPT
ncbi:hypothetical protein D3C77_675470 [compost metagenome]